MCLDLHHIWPASTEGHTNTRQTIMRNKYRQAPSLHHVTWICMLTAVRNFLSLTPTPPHPHIHLSNMTPLPTRKIQGSEPSSRTPHLVYLQATNEWAFRLNVNDVCCGLIPFRQEGLLLSPLPCSPVREGDQTMDHFHDMWESLLFQWLPGRQPLPSLFEAFGSITTGAHLMWSPHLTSSSLPQAQTAGGTEQTRGAADCCRPFTCKYRDQAWVWVQYWRCPLHWGPSVCAYMSVCAYTAGKRIWLCVSMRVHASVFSCMCMAWSSTSKLYSCQIAANVLIQKHSVVSNYI